MNKKEERLEEKVFSDTKAYALKAFEYHMGQRSAKPSKNKLNKTYAEYIQFRANLICKKFGYAEITVDPSWISILETYPGLTRPELVLLAIESCEFDTYNNKVWRKGNIEMKKISLEEYGDTFYRALYGIIGELDQVLLDACLYAIKLLLDNGRYFVDRELIAIVANIVENFSDDTKNDLIIKIDQMIIDHLTEELYCFADINLLKEPYFILEAILSKDETSAYSMVNINGEYAIARKVGEISDEGILLLSNMAKAINQQFKEQIIKQNVKV